MKIDYIEETSLKLHIDIFNKTSLTEEYVLGIYKIHLYKNNDYIEYHITDTSLQSYKNRFSYIVPIKQHNFERFLTLLKSRIEIFETQH